MFVYVTDMLCARMRTNTLVFSFPRDNSELNDGCFTLHLISHLTDYCSRWNDYICLPIASIREEEDRKKTILLRKIVNFNRSKRHSVYKYKKVDLVHVRAVLINIFYNCINYIVLPNQFLITLPRQSRHDILSRHS